MPRLIALDTKLFPAEILVRADHISAVEIQHDGDNGVTMRVSMSGGFVYPSYRFDGSDAAVLAKLRAARDALVDEIRAVLAEDRPPLPTPATAEKRSL
jgi:hypothetical protein